MDNQKEIEKLFESRSEKIYEGFQEALNKYNLLDMRIIEFETATSPTKTKILDDLNEVLRENDIQGLYILQFTLIKGRGEECRWKIRLKNGRWIIKCE
ncbi:hypothetical protein C7293_08820 [filamentous cyanobacterium CCT1]|nr:hypothetical protein C7293_08820 [filamentous cyanobacterium CCT1]PSN80381.1 hypothetical protein C8B47_06865 [filamentous cyanobacterium CCP4]